MKTTETKELLAAFASGEGVVPADFLDASPDGILIFDSSRRIVFANIAAKNAFGRRSLPLGESLEQLHQTVRLFQAPGQVPIPDEADPVIRALAGETVERSEYRVQFTRVGETGWVECGAHPIAGSGAIVFIRDITLRKRREMEMKSADQLSDFIYQGNLAGILHTTIDGRIVDCNEAIVRMLGYSSKEELKAVRMQQLYFDAEERNRMLRLIQGPRRLNELELCFRRRDGARRWALINVCLLDPQPGRVGGNLVATVVDITERKLWEETVRQSEQRFSAFMDHLPGVAFIKDLSGKYVYYNEAAWRLFGKRPAEIVGKTDEEIWPSENAAQYRANDANVIEAGQPVEAVEPVAHPDGVHSWLIYKFPILEDGKTTLVGGIGIDVTERLALESQLTQAGKMEALGRLAGGVAHDFNNLLTVISGYGQLALECIGSAPAERLETYVHEILTSARRAAGLTGQLLAFSRRQSLQMRVLDLGDLLRDFERLLERMIGEHVELKVRCPDEPCLIRADGQQIEQVLMNLAINSRDAMPLGGTLEIECQALKEPVERQGLGPLGVLVEVRDTGIGIEESVKAKIFEPFFTSKDKAKGTGLGLSTVYGIVTQAGGAIEVESEPGEGTTFRIYFPRVAAAEPAESSPPPPESASPGTETVLLVEDDPSVRSLVEAILRKLGYRVLVADSGLAGLDVWREHGAGVDILLTDVIMPHMSGSDLAKKLRESRPGLKVLFMSGYTDDMIESHGVLGSETQLIAKPFTAEQLGRRLRAVLQS